MSGGTFVGTVVVWLLLLALGAVVVYAAIAGNIIPLIIVFSVLYVCSTLRWVWLLGKQMETEREW